MICDNLTINELCSPRHTPGRGNASAPIAIVLLALGSDMQRYHSLVMSPIKSHYRTIYPKSVHYAIYAAGHITQYVHPGDTAWALDSYHNPTWPLLPAASDPNSPYIFIGLEGDGTATSTAQIASAADLVCCLATHYSIPIDELHILVARDLNDERCELWSVPPSLIASAQVCQQNGGLDPLPNVVTMAAQVAALQVCCDTHTAQLASLQGRVASLEPLVDHHEDAIGLLQTWQAAVNTQLAGFSGALASLQQSVTLMARTLAEHQTCIDEVCGTKPDEAIHYQRITQQPITPLVAVRIDANVKLSDTTPASVLPGPLWTATLEPGTVYVATVTARIDYSQWCAGKQGVLEIVVCGTPIIIDADTATGEQVMNLSGSVNFSVSAGCESVYFQVRIDDTTTPLKYLSFVDVRIERL